MTDFEKECYNMFIIVSRGDRGKPFKLRKNFKGFEDKEEYLYLQRLCNIFKRNPSIEPFKFLSAPYKVWKNEEYFDLQFYTKPKAIKTYKLYLQKNGSKNWINL